MYDIKKSNVDFQLNLFIKAIDTRNLDTITNFMNNDNSKCINKRDIVFEIYNKKLLTSEKLSFIIENYNNSLYISSSLMKALIKDNNNDLLEIIFNNFKFYDNEFIKWLLFQYRNQTIIPLIYLNQQISNKKYSISKLDKVYYKSKNPYLFKVCHDDNIHLLKYLKEHGSNINKDEVDCKTPLFYACE
ncbi:hypothetical protein H8356DRAFT_1067843, partial [Neocallimastix lanati (nom. inval.)]